MFSKKLVHLITLVLLSFLFPQLCFASMGCEIQLLNATNSIYGIIAVTVFIIAYILIILEEFIHLRKSKPVIIASGIIWLIVALLAKQQGTSEIAHQAIKANILEYAELFLLLLAAMTYVNAMEERKVFDSLRSWLVSKGFSYKQLFWITGFLAFFISPIADNLTTALLMCAVVLAVGKNNKNFVNLACINIVVAANAGGAFSPFGDITTLMVWQEHMLTFDQFFKIFLPSLISFLIPAVCMSYAIKDEIPQKLDEKIKLELGAKRIMLLFLLTIATAISFHNFLHLPAAVGMMTGLGYLKFFGYYIKMKELKLKKKNELNNSIDQTLNNLIPFDIIKKIERAEWDTLLFFYGVLLCVGGLALIGYLELLSNIMYEEWGASFSTIHKQTPANVMIGILSSIVDNVPVMFAVLTMNPDMSQGQWLLVTLTAGIGGSLLSVGSAAGVALMGQARGHYTFFSHLKWSWAILIGYIAGIISHIIINKSTF